MATTSKLAPAPFDRDNADVILRSADDVDFRVHSQILATASPVFEDMLVVARPDTEKQTSFEEEPPIPVVSLTESCDTLDALLRICYPIKKPDRARPLDTIPTVLEAALKYLMDWPVSVLVKELLALAQEHPLQVWAIGCRFGLEDVAREGVQAALPLKPLGTYNYAREFVPVQEFVRDAQGISAGDYYRLQEFYRLGGAVPPSFLHTRPLADASQPDPRVPAQPPVVNFYTILIPYPDIICRAADGLEIQMHKGVLSMSSLKLKERVSTSMRSVVHPPNTDEGSDVPQPLPLPVVEFPETGAVLAALLRLCYVGLHSLPDDVPLLLAVLNAAVKYEMMMHIISRLQSHWVSVASRTPLSAYFAAMQAGMQEEARVAARYTLRLEIPREYVPEMESSTAQVYHRLLDYHERVRLTASSIVRTLSSNHGDPAPRTAVLSGQGNAPSNASQQNSGMVAPHVASGPCCQGPGCHGTHVYASPWYSNRRAEYLKYLQEHPQDTLMWDERSLLGSPAPLTFKTERPWCACCFDVATSIVRRAWKLPERVSVALDRINI